MQAIKLPDHVGVYVTIGDLRRLETAKNEYVKHLLEAGPLTNVAAKTRQECLNLSQSYEACITDILLMITDAHKKAQ